MGKDLYDNFPTAKKVFDDAGSEVENWCFEGTKEMLRQTHITQPCIYAVTMAAYEAFKEAADKAEISGDMEIVGYAGFSLGEYAALTATGVIDSLAKGLEIVKKRGNFMQAAGLDAQGNPIGGMVAGFGNREDILKVVEEVAGGRVLRGVNFNSPVQTVVAGEKAALEDFIAVAKTRKVKAKMLSVSTAFHCEVMNPAAADLEKILKEANLKTPDSKVYSNVTAKDMMENFAGGDASVEDYIASLMAQQAKEPVYWQEIIENMINDGAQIIVEIGPGKTLSGLTKKINGDVVTLHVEDHESLEHTIKVLEEEARK